MESTIAFVAGQLSGGGAEKQLLYLLQGLAAYPVRVTLATLNPGDPGEAAVAALGIPVFRIPRSRWKLDRIARLAVWLRREQPLLVHSWAFHCNAYTAWAGALAGVPVRLGSLRGDAFYENTVQWNAPPLFMRLGMEVPHAVVVNSAAAAASLAARGPWGDRTRVVPNAIDLSALEQAAARSLAHPEAGADDPASTASPAERDAAAPVLALVGNLIPRKNAPMFLRVIASLTGSYPHLEGWLIGEGPERPALEALAREMGVAGRVRFWGRRPDVARLLRQVDVICHCSHSEGLANALMEASGLGLPVVATRTGGTAEIVEEGVTGFLVEPDDDAAMVGAVYQLLLDPELRRCLGEAGRQKMERHFSLDRMVRSMVAVYREFLDGKALDAALNQEVDHDPVGGTVPRALPTTATPVLTSKQAGRRSPGAAGTPPPAA